MAARDDYFDALEVRDPTEREAALFDALPGHIRHAQANSPAYARLLREVHADEITGRDALAGLPVTRKSELVQRQKAEPPFGGFAATPLSGLIHVFASPGPIFEPEGKGEDYWRMARSLHAAGFRRGELIHNAFSYHFTPAGSMLETGARAVGCAVFPAGIGQTELQVAAIAHLRPDGYVGTPSFLNIILEKAAELGADCSSLSKGVVGGEALPPSLRAQIEAHGVAVLQCYATADVGLIAYESAAREGLIVDEGVIVEIVRPGTGEPVSPGEVGEILVTVLNPDYPLIRFATGDLSAELAGRSPCGRTNTRIKGWMGRADQTTKVRGMFVHPSQVAQVLGRHPQVSKARLVVDNASNQDVLSLHCEVEGEPGAELVAAISASLREVCKLRGDVVFVEPGTLANDGKVIDDVRTYE